MSTIDTSPIEVVVRCKNEMPHVERTLSTLTECGARVLFIDSGSTDGSLECAEDAGVDIVRIAPESYVPGRVLNDAMRRTRGDVVAFVNADAVPLGREAVSQLVARCTAGAAAAFGRQLPRTEARPLTKADYARAFPENVHDPKLSRFFSMAASAIRRDVWNALPFDERLRFSEDVDWTMRLRALGFAIDYVPRARFEHSHDYDVEGMRRRMRGEGEAESRIQRRAKPSVWRELFRPMVGSTLRDARAGVLSFDSLRLRWSGERGRFSGLREAARTPLAPVDSRGARSRNDDRFTAGGRRADEELVARALTAARDRIHETLGDRAKATILVGSFGCGEGIVRGPQNARRIYGDLDLVVLVRDVGEARRARSFCAALSEEVSRSQNATVDIWPASEEEIIEPRGRLMWIDAALRGARVIDGDREVLRPLERFGARAAVGEEIARLLANRATGLALSRLAAEGGRHDGVTSARHVAKAWLAAGDALLLLVDRYDATSSERLARLQSFAAIGAPAACALVDGYAWAVATRAASEDASLSEAQLHSESLRIWSVHAAIERHRLGIATLGTPDEYAELESMIYRELSDVPVASRILGGARAAAHQFVAWRLAGRHPRETLARVATLLAFAPDRVRARGWAAHALAAVSDHPNDVERALISARDIAA
jgi:rhamnosyltransferase